METSYQDDNELITAAWLISNGFTEGRSPAGGKFWEKNIVIQEHGFGEGSTRHWIRVHDADEEWWPIEMYQQGRDQKTPDGVAMLSWIDRTTRGHLRRLFAALESPLD